MSRVALRDERWEDRSKRFVARNGSYEKSGI
jgi:hypothetical protein